MARSLLTLLLLLHYLLVVSVGGRPDRPVTRPFAYVHSHHCQLQNAWRGGTCFEDCNGMQYRVHKDQKPTPLQQRLASLKSMDLHCLPTAAAPVGSAVFGVASRPQPSQAAGMPAGVSGKIDAPPRRG